MNAMGGQMNMTADQMIIALGEALGRYRALSERESMWLERAIRREDARAGVASPTAWTQSDDQALLSKAGKISRQELALMLRRSLPAVDTRLCMLRKQQKAKACLNKRARKVSQGAPM